MLSRVTCGALCLALSLPVLSAQPEPAELLVGMSEAARTATYQGVIVYQGGNTLETMRVTHAFAQGAERERVQSLTGEPREILKQDSKVICLLPKDRKLTMQRPTPKGLFVGLNAERVQQIAEVYEFAELGEQRVAGRTCRGVAIKPRDPYRYGYEVWADQATHLPLKVDLVDQAGKVLERMMFTEVDFPSAIPETAFQTALDTRNYREVTRTVNEGTPPPANAGQQFVRLPPGFRVTMRDVRPLPDGRGTVEHLLLSDGLSAISVFTASRQEQAKPFEGASQMGAVSAYGRLIGRVHITVVGEAPAQTVQMIGDSVRPMPEAADPGESTQPAAVRRP